MTRYRFRGIFLLLLMGHATACATTSWDNPLRSGFSASENDLEDNASVVEDYIELSQPDRILVRTRVGTDFRDRGQFYLDFPFVEGDNIVSVDSISVPIADIVVFMDSMSVPITDVSVAGYVEESQPDRIRVRTRDRGQFEMDFPFVEGDNIVSVDSMSVPIADLGYLEGDASIIAYIELTQPELIRVRTRDRGQLFYLDFPFVEGDNIVSVDSISVPIADVVNLESGYSLNSGQNAGALLLVGIGIVGLFAWLMGGDDDGSYCDDFFAYGKWGC
ncbi:hypothetical protein CMN24_03730 [Candidatus Saccharibacteria bacterium]|nr:hypothetical protein [Candidatus Saccharibacteria bacterium]